MIAGGGYKGNLAGAVKNLGWELSVVLRPDEPAKKFQALPLRWTVERMFPWIENCWKKISPSAITFLLQKHAI